MPIFRYFIFVGGALLALLFAVNLALPEAPATQSVVVAGRDVPLIRIHSDRKLPERVVLDTSQPTIVPSAVQTAAVVAPRPPVRAESSPALNELSSKAKVRDTFAQLVSPGSKPGATTVKRAQPRRKIARNRPYYWPPGQPMVVAQQPHFGVFNMTW